MDKLTRSILILLCLPAIILGGKMASIFSKYGSEKLDFFVYSGLSLLFGVSAIALILFSFPLVDKLGEAWRITQITDSFCIGFIISSAGDWLKFSQQRKKNNNKEDKRNE